MLICREKLAAWLEFHSRAARYHLRALSLFDVSVARAGASYDGSLANCFAAKQIRLRIIVALVRSMRVHVSTGIAAPPEATSSVTFASY
jgi:hypothetical protein